MLNKSAASVDLRRFGMVWAGHGGSSHREWTYDPLPKAIHLDPSYSVA